MTHSVLSLLQKVYMKTTHKQQIHSHTQTAVRLVTEEKRVKKDEGTEGVKPQGTEETRLWRVSAHREGRCHLTNCPPEVYITLTKGTPTNFILKILKDPLSITTKLGEEMFYFFKQQNYILFTYLLFTKDEADDGWILGSRRGAVWRQPSDRP